MVARIAQLSAKDLGRQMVTRQISDLEFQAAGRDMTTPTRVMESISESTCLP